VNLVLKTRPNKANFCTKILKNKPKTFEVDFSVEGIEIGSVKGCVGLAKVGSKMAYTATAEAVGEFYGEKTDVATGDGWIVFSPSVLNFDRGAGPLPIRIINDTASMVATNGVEIRPNNEGVNFVLKNPNNCGNRQYAAVQGNVRAMCTMMVDSNRGTTVEYLNMKFTSGAVLVGALRP
jgi:hypothetical protein